MKDSEHLQWLHDRIINVYNEDKNVDFLIRLRKIIKMIEGSEKSLMEQLSESFINNLDELQSDGSIQSYSIDSVKLSDEEVVFDIGILPKHGVRGIKTNFTVTKDGVSFDDEKK